MPRMEIGWYWYIHLHGPLPLYIETMPSFHVIGTLPILCGMIALVQLAISASP